jgi:hypothetical protein
MDNSPPISPDFNRLLTASDHLPVFFIGLFTALPVSIFLWLTLVWFFT